MRTTSAIWLRAPPEVNSLLPACPKCRVPLPLSHYNVAEFLPCSQCRTPIRVAVFAALAHRPPRTSAVSRPLADGEASCFYHPAKPAATVCDGCGRFLCALCDVELSGQHFCAPCLETGQRKRTLTQLETRRVLYDNIALALAILPVLSCFLFPVTSPLAIAVAIWGWRKPSSLLPRTRVRFVLAILIGLLGLGLSIAWWITIFAS